MTVSPLLLLGVFLTLSAYAQGFVDFSSSVLHPIYTNSQSFPPPGQLPNQMGRTTGAGHYTIGLYIAPVGTTDPNAFTLMGPTALNHNAISQSGIGNGGFNGNPRATSFVISNNTGQTIAFQVRAWSTFAGLTYDQAFSSCCGAYLGSSAIGTVTPAVGITPPPVLFGINPGQIGSFTLFPNGFSPATNPVPEPASGWLVLLGVAAGFGAFRYPFRRR